MYSVPGGAISRSNVFHSERRFVYDWRGFRFTGWRLLMKTTTFLSIATTLLFATSAFAQAPGDDVGAPARAEIGPKVAAARAILDGWQAKDPERADRKLHIVLWTPNDREPAPMYRERLTKILGDIRGFYAKEMERVGFGPRTIGLDMLPDGLLNIHVVRGAGPYADYKTESGQQIRAECAPVLRQAGINVAEETIVIFCNMANWNAEKRTISQNSPYYAGGTNRSGTAWQVDSPILNLDGLTEKGAHVDDGQYGHISLGRYNSIFIGGICHELGHALTLPHCRERADERAAFGTALMGSGNRTYGEDRRDDGRGSFLTLAHALRLASHPIFCGSVKGMKMKPTVQPTELAIEQKGKGFVFSGRAVAEPPVYGVVAYMDPDGGSDYDSTTATAVPDAEGRFSLDCQALKAGRGGELRITFLQANGIPSGFLSDTPFRYSYRVPADGTADITAARTSMLFAPVLAALDAKNPDAAAKLLAGPKLAADALAQKLGRRLLNAKPIAPGEVSAETKSIALSELTSTRAETGYGAPVRDRLPGTAGLLRSGGAIFEHGFYAHAPSVYEWSLDGSWKSLAGRVGLADGNEGSIEAVIEGDGKILWKSSKLKTGTPVAFTANIEGVKKLVLKTTDAGDGTRADWGVWLEPVLAR